MQRLQVDVDSCELDDFEDMLNRLKDLTAPMLVRLYNYGSEPNDTGALYYFDLAETGDRLLTLAERIKSASEPPFSQTNLGFIALAGINALALARKLGIEVAGLDLGVMYVSKDREITVNLIEAYLEKSSDSVVDVLARCVYLKEECSAEEKQALVDLVPAELRETIEELLRPNPDYLSLSEHLPVLDSAPSSIFCSSCQTTKSPSIDQICERHYFCSAACLHKVQEMHGASDQQCPLCTVKLSRYASIKRKPAINPQTCVFCQSQFQLNPTENWRLKDGNTDTKKSYCSNECFTRHFPPAAVSSSNAMQMENCPCLVCGVLASIECTLLCETHSLCSENCKTAYYFGEKLEEHLYQERLICYECLEEWLREIDRIGEIPELEDLFNKIVKRQEKCCAWEQEKKQEVAQCGSLVSLSALRRKNFRLICIFCGNSVVVQKQFAASFAINDTTPFLLSCEWNIHGVCSTRCMRLNLPRSGLQTIRCPKCPNALITIETLQTALNHRNPTQECLRRTPYLDRCNAECETTYVQPLCRHEFCAETVSRYQCEDLSSVVCCICGVMSSYEEVLATAHEITLAQEEL